MFVAALIPETQINQGTMAAALSQEKITHLLFGSL